MVRGWLLFVLTLLLLVVVFWLLLLPPPDDFLLFDFDDEFDFFTLFCDLCFDVLLDDDDWPDDVFVGVVGFIFKLFESCIQFLSAIINISLFMSEIIFFAVDSDSRCVVENFVPIIIASSAICENNSLHEIVVIHATNYS